MRPELCDNLAIENKLLELSRPLETVKGKNVYGYLKKSVKAQVDAVADELAKLPEVEKCCKIWWRLQCQNARYLMDKLLRDGPLLIPDTMKARYWFEQAAVQGHTTAQYALWKLLLSDDVEVRNLEEGLRWLETATENGSHYAAHWLGKEYLRGKTVDVHVASSKIEPL